MNMRKQLAIGVLLVLTASTAVGEEVWQASWIGVAETSGITGGAIHEGTGHCHSEGMKERRETVKTGPLEPRTSGPVSGNR